MRRSRSAALAVSAFLPAPAWAHHFMDGSVPRTPLEGFLSGLAHPVIGPEHLAFVVATALAGVAARRIVLVPLVFVLATGAGCVVRLGAGTATGGEAAAVATALLAGLLVALAWRRLTPGFWIAFAAVGGAVHGHAYGAAVVGAEPSPVGAYLAGFVAVQAVLGCGGAYAVARLLRHREDLAEFVFRAGGVGAGMLAALVVVQA